MRSPTWLAALLAVVAPAVAWLAPADAAAVQPISVAEILQRGSSGVGYSYWWGGDTWDPSAREFPGGCSGSCPSCRHYSSRSFNGSRATGPQWGADCSGFLGKVWRVPDSNSDLTRYQHPFVASAWLRSKPGYWKRVSTVQAGDARSRGRHVYLVGAVTSRGNHRSMEANSCALGITQLNRSAGSKSYVTTRREGLGSENRPPDVAEKPRGRSQVEAGHPLNVCTRATDPDTDRVRYHFVATGAQDGAEVTRTSTAHVRSGGELCGSVTLSRPGRYQLRARTQDEPGAYARDRSAPLEVEVLPRRDRSSGQQGSGSDPCAAPTSSCMAQLSTFTMQCQASADCGAGLACVFSSSGSSCTRACAGPADCASGQACAPATNAAGTGGNVCVPRATREQRDCLCQAQQASSCGSGGAGGTSGGTGTPTVPDPMTTGGDILVASMVDCGKEPVSPLRTRCEGDSTCNGGLAGTGRVCSDQLMSCQVGCHSDADCPGGGTCTGPGGTCR